MYNPVNDRFQVTFSRERNFKRITSSAPSAGSRAPRSFCFSWRSRHAIGSGPRLLRTQMLGSKLEAAV